MIKKFNKSVLLVAMALGLLFVSVTPQAMAQDRCRSRGRYVQSNYQGGRDYDTGRRYDNRYNDYRNYDYYDREDTTGKAVKRTAIGAGIGALGGAIIGGKKGALIGAGVGAAGGYIYHRNKVNNDRRYRW